MSNPDVPIEMLPLALRACNHGYTRLLDLKAWASTA